IVLNSDTQINVFSGDLTLGGTFTGTGHAISKSGIGMVVVGRVTASSLNIDRGVLRLSEKQTANSPSGTSVVQSLTMSAGTTLDLFNNSFVIDYSGAVGNRL